MNFDIAALTKQIIELNAHMSKLETTLTQLETFIPWLLAALAAIALGLWVRR